MDRRLHTDQIQHAVGDHGILIVFVTKGGAEAVSLTVIGKMIGYFATVGCVFTEFGYDLDGFFVVFATVSCLFNIFGNDRAVGFVLFLHAVGEETK